MYLKSGYEHLKEKISARKEMCQSKTQQNHKVYQSQKTEGGQIHGPEDHKNNNLKQL